MGEDSIGQIPHAMRPIFDQIAAMTDAFCSEHLNDEYAELCRKRPSPLLKLGLETWACGIVYTAGRHNFVFDKDTEPYISSADLVGAFGISNGLAASRAKAIREALRMRDLDPNWMLPSLIDETPFAWFIQVNGLVVDAREMPRDIQEEASRLGLIPYVPG